MKIRGFRIDTAAVEAALTRAPGVRQAFVDAREARAGDLRLVGYLVPDRDASVDPVEVRTYVRDRLPEYTVPSALVVLDAFPLVPNGKLCRHRLPTPDFTAVAVRPPRTPGEQTLCALFAEVLRRPEVGIDDDFFDLGGSPELAVELARRARAELSTDVRPALLSRAPTVAGLAQLLGVGRPVRPPLGPKRWRSKVKIGGHAIAPCEVAATLMATPGVKQAVVAVREDRPGDRKLVGYLVPADDSTLSLADVRGYLTGQLPDHMVPSAFVFLDTVPLNEKGTLDRPALPAPDHHLSAADSLPTARTPGEELLCGLFAEVLDLPEVEVDQDFFELGGNSLLAIRLTNRIRAAFGVTMEVKEVFEDPTVAALARRLGDETLLRPPARGTSAGEPGGRH
ncbi:phosphopantetheine-binding protein [Streptomyces cellulosae]|nr:phosphopantetheine-binding protein [Streptomyces cellulosae]WTB92824.1 phosphopantetheine-binding protein [Streptomyces cellulosae]WTC53836.1 phosphopantetheine-binding protein [Streptomyces cellulosae]WTC60202.1 phosphopantetheine-binding protein [Streptomyces cellulosae]